MINNLLAALIALGFIHRNMDDDESKKVQNASWIRVLIYFVLTSLTLIAFYKTYQVATIKSQLYVYGIRGAMFHNDSTNTEEIGDTVSITVHTVFNSERFSFKESQETLESGNPQELTSRMGGTDFCMRLNGEKKYSIRTYPDVTREKMENEDLKVIDGNGPLYYIRHINTEIPMLFPFLTEIEYTDYGLETNEYPDSTITYTRNRIMPLEGHLPELGYLGSYGGMSLIERGAEFYGSQRKQKEYITTVISLANNYNTMNFFTAADLTQCSFDVNVFSDCPVDFVRFNFNIPVEISPMYLKMDTLDAYGFQISDKETLSGFSSIESGFHGQRIRFHAKLPTLSNMQLIRSLILTTLLTTFISLLLSNLYYWIKKIIYTMYVRKESIMKEHLKRLDKNRKKLKLLSFSAMIIGAVILLRLGWLVLINHPIKIASSNWDNYMDMFPLIVFGIICILFISFIIIIKNKGK